MKKLFIILALLLPLCSCKSISSYDGNSTKEWIYIESSKQNLEGKTIDVCYRLDVHFSPEEATQRFDTDKACITRCCWYSDTKKITLNLNTDFAQELKQNGKANKYSLDTLVFNVRYSSLLDTIHASLTPSSILRSDGLITLDYSTVNDDDGLLQIDLGDLKVQEYPVEEEKEDHSGKYLLKEQEEAMAQHQEAVNELREMAEYQKVDTGITKGEEEPDEDFGDEEEDYPATPKTVIGTLKTQTVSVKTYQKNNEPVQREVVYSSKVYDLNDPEQRQELLQKKLAYERSQAISLLKQFYEQDIDEYIRFIDKQQAAKGNILLANDREWKTAKIGYPIYRVKCNVKGKLGKTQNTMKDYPIPCGVYEVQLDDKTVLPRDITAITIINKDYKY